MSAWGSWAGMRMAGDYMSAARHHLSAAVWHYNGAVARREQTVVGELPPLDPPHYGRVGLFYGSILGLGAGGVAYARTEDVLPTIATFAVTTFLGYLFGGSVSRER